MLIDVSQPDNPYGAILREYCELASKKTLSEEDADRLSKILTQAEQDHHLSFLLNEADHFMAHHLGLLDVTQRHRYEDQQAKLREYLGSQKSPQDSTDLPQLRGGICCSEFEYSATLSRRGWYIRHCA